MTNSKRDDPPGVYMPTEEEIEKAKAIFKRKHMEKMKGRNGRPSLEGNLRVFHFKVNHGYVPVDV